jgi:hypothetical protein
MYLYAVVNKICLIYKFLFKNGKNLFKLPLFHCLLAFLNQFYFKYYRYEIFFPIVIFKYFSFFYYVKIMVFGLRKIR